MRALVRQAVTAAQAQGAVRILRVTVRLGALGHGWPEQLEGYFRQAAQGTPAEGAEFDTIATNELMELVLDSLEMETIEAR